MHMLSVREFVDLSDKVCHLFSLAVSPHEMSCLWIDNPLEKTPRCGFLVNQLTSNLIRQRDSRYLFAQNNSFAIISFPLDWYKGGFFFGVSLMTFTKSASVLRNGIVRCPLFWGEHQGLPVSRATACLGFQGLECSQSGVI